MSAENSWRLSVDEIDQSSTIKGEAGSVGAMVIRASKGNAKPVYISKGQQQRILDLYGYPSVSYPDVWEAIEYNKQDALWISAPYANDALLGGVLVKSTGTEALGAGVNPTTLAYTFTDATEYFVLATISPYSDDLGVKISKNTSTGFYTTELYKKKKGVMALYKTYVVSLVSGTKDGFGKNIYIEDVLKDDDYLQVILNSTRNDTGFVNDSSVVNFAGGDRGTAITITEITDGWNYFQQGNTYPADIFMDTIADGGIPAIFNSLRNTYQKYKTYIIKLPIGENVATAISTKDGYSISNSGLSFSWNYGKVKDSLSGTTFWTSLIGRVGVKFAQMNNIFNGLAPAWIDENGHGGQLGPGIIELEFDPTEDELKTLDDEGINPIVKYPGYGVMITSQKTGQSPDNLSDTSWIAHRRLFDYIISNTLKQVLTYQIVKLNDEVHRRMAASKEETLIAPILASNLLAEAKVQCDSNNNDSVALANRQFVLTLGIRVTPFSETIKFEFINVSQTTSVEEVIG